MKLRNRFWRTLFSLLGILCLATGAYFAYWWFYQLAPVRRTLDPQWRASHSPAEYWREIQEEIHRGMWLHDDGVTVGIYGDKSWAEWIMKRVKPVGTMGCLGGYPTHAATAMRFLTNQDVGEDADAWLQWWARNKDKSQNEWQTDGFVQRGIKIDVPPTPEQVPRLLALLGKVERQGSPGVPAHVSYNAFRCLRDSGFDPVTFALSHREMSTETERGLLEYSRRYRHSADADGLGVLAFGWPDSVDRRVPLPELLTRDFQIKVYALIFLPLIVDVALLYWACRRRKKIG